MFKAKTQIDVHNGKKAIERIGRVSDNLIGIGPFGIGLDGILAWVPGLGEAYSIGAGAALVLEGYRARVPASVLVQAGVLVSIRTLANIFPVLGGVIVDFFRGHRMAARLLVQAIDDTLYIEGVPDRDHPEYAGVLARIRSGEERRRVVFLG
ncbi:MAG TPA: DUF4112 domain-containing protein [Caulobacteraceae bacterium]|nr:DUF4112 domain-containing protein [Caulobacteraceae bacterium]